MVLSSHENTVIDQQTLLIDEKHLIVALTQRGHLYMCISEICDLIGINARAQIRRIQRSTDLQQGLLQLMVQTLGGRQKINSLDVALIEPWLSGLRREILSAEQQHMLDRCFPLAHQAQICFEKHPIIASMQFEQTDHQALTIISPHPETLAQFATLPFPISEGREVVSVYPEDQAFREGVLATKQRWTLPTRGTIPSLPYYIASNKIQVYLGNPSDPSADLAESLKRIGELTESTILTARIVMALWIIRCHDGKINKQGSVPISMEEILDWRGIQKHSRPAYPGAFTRITDGYDERQKRRVTQDFALLQQCYLRRAYTISTTDMNEQLLIEAPYLRVSTIKKSAQTLRELTLWSTSPDEDNQEEEIIGFLVSPGDWLFSYPGLGIDRFALIDRRIFAMHAQQDQHALRIALYLVERWRQQMLSTQYEDTMMMRDLLAAAMIEPDLKHTTRFAERIEGALHKLYEQQILGQVPECVTTIDKTQNWGEQWMRSTWRLIPPEEILQFYHRSEQLLPLSSPQNSTRTRVSKGVRKT